VFHDGLPNVAGDENGELADHLIGSTCHARARHHDAGFAGHLSIGFATQGTPMQLGDVWRMRPQEPLQTATRSPSPSSRASNDLAS
jgi:hypothetical protein